MVNNRFSTGIGNRSAVYCCSNCGRRTRQTGAFGELCPQCDEILSLENGITDGCYSEDSEALVRTENLIKQLKAEVTKRGGEI